MKTIRQLLARTPAGRTATEARAGVVAAEAERADSARRLAETRDHLAAEQAAFVSELVALAFQFGRIQGRAEANRERIDEMTAQTRTDTP